MCCRRKPENHCFWEDRFLTGCFYPWVCQGCKTLGGNRILKALGFSSISKACLLFQEGQKLLMDTGSRQDRSTTPYISSPSILLSYGLWKTRVWQSFTRSLIEPSSANSVLHGPGLGGSAHHRGVRQMPISNRNICSFQLRKICWQRKVQEDSFDRKKLKSTPQKEGPILLGYIQPILQAF